MTEISQDDKLRTEVVDKLICEATEKGTANDFWIVCDSNSENFRDCLQRTNTQGLIDVIVKLHKSLKSRKILDSIALYASGDKAKAEKDAKRRAKNMKDKNTENAETVNEGSCAGCETMRASYKERAAKEKRNAGQMEVLGNKKMQQRYKSLEKLHNDLANDPDTKCDKCRETPVKEMAEYDNPVNVAHPSRALGASTNDTVYGKAEWRDRIYKDNANDAMDPEHKQSIKVPAELLSMLKQYADMSKKRAENLNVTQKQDEDFYMRLHYVFTDLHRYLESGTVYDLKMASIYLSGLMGPMLYEIPTEVVRFIAHGGKFESLKGYVNSITPPKMGYGANGEMDRMK